MQKEVRVKKRGNRLGFWFFQMAARLTGLRGAYGFLYFVCLHYLLFDKTARQTAICYTEKRFGRGLKKYWHAYRLFISQGKMLIDRYAFAAGYKKFKMSLVGEDVLRDLDQQEKGFILLISHIGNWQLLLSPLQQLKKPIYFLMRPQDNPAVESSLRIGREKITVISPEGYLGGVVEVTNAINNGGIVCIMGDRAYGFETVEVDFLGHKAYFPYGAFQIAASTQCTMIIHRSQKTGHAAYVVDTTGVLNPKFIRGADKRTQLAAFVQEYVKVLEEYTKIYPYQFFLFFDVWQLRDASQVI